MIIIMLIICPMSNLLLFPWPYFENNAFAKVELQFKATYIAHDAATATPKQW